MNWSGQSILDLIAPSHRLQILDYIQRRAAGEDIPSLYETRGLHRDGTEFDMEVHVSTFELGGELDTVPIRLWLFNERNKLARLLRLLVLRFSLIEDGEANYRLQLCAWWKWPGRLLWGLPPRSRVLGEDTS